MIDFIYLILFFWQLGNFNSFEGVLYCNPHFDQLFKRTGSLDKSFDGNFFNHNSVDGERHHQNREINFG